MASPRVWPPFHLLPPKHSHASTWPQHRIRVPYRICQRCAQGTSDLSCRSLPRVWSSVKSNSESSRVVWQLQRHWVPCQVAWWRPLMQFEGNTATKCNLLAFRGEKSQLGAIHGCQPPALRRLAQSSMLLVHSKEQYWYKPSGGLQNCFKALTWGFPKIGVPQNGWFIKEHPIKMDDLGVPLFLETPALTCLVVGCALFSACQRLQRLRLPLAHYELHISPPNFPMMQVLTCRTAST